jgi:AcrR family transcriptional regulator
MSVRKPSTGRQRQKLPRRDLRDVIARKRTYLPGGDRKAQILDVARRLFAARGFHDANIDDICREAGIARGTLYQYFENKDAVMLEVMNQLCERVGAVLEARPPIIPIKGANQAPVELIVGFCRKRLRQLLDAVFIDEPALRLILVDARGLNGAVDEIIARIDKIILKSMEADLRTAQELRLMRKGNVKLMARYILGGVEKMVLTALSLDEPIDLDAIVNVAIELELFGLLHEDVKR